MEPSQHGPFCCAVCGTLWITQYGRSVTVTRSPATVSSAPVVTWHAPGNEGVQLTSTQVRPPRVTEIDQANTTV